MFNPVPYLVELSPEQCKQILTRPKIKQIQKSLNTEQIKNIKNKQGDKGEQLSLFKT